MIFILLLGDKKTLKTQTKITKMTKTNNEKKKLNLLCLPVLVYSIYWIVVIISVCSHATNVTVLSIIFDKNAVVNPIYRPCIEVENGKIHKILYERNIQQKLINSQSPLRFNRFYRDFMQKIDVLAPLWITHFRSASTISHRLSDRINS